MKKSVLLSSLVLLICVASCPGQPAAQSLMDLKPEKLAPNQPDSREHSPFVDEKETESTPAARLWLRSEYLLWWIKDSNLPILVTSGSAADALPGAIGQPGTAIQFGGGNISNYTRSGGRFSAGWFFDDDHQCGIEGNYFFLGSRSAKLNLRSDALPGSLILGRPFFDVTTGLPDVGLIALPNLSSGTVEALSTSRLQGAEIMGSAQLVESGSLNLTGLVGFRYLQLDESVSVFDNEKLFPNVLLIGGDSISTADRFSAGNRFYGGQVGVRGDWHIGRWSLEFLGKIALGSTHEAIRIQGATAVVSPAAGLTVFPSGFLAQATNIGSMSTDAFAVLPEAGITARFQITDHLAASIGYTFIYISSVTRPGDAIDLGLNPTQIPLSLTGGTLAGPARPIATVRETDFWAQGINFGIQITY